MKRLTQGFINHVREVLLLDKSPHRASLAFAIGIFIAFAPHIGLHTISVVGISWLSRLNLPIMMVGAYVNNPWTIVPMYGACLGVGNYLIGNGFLCMPSEMSWEESIAFLKKSPLPFVVGTLTVGTVASVLSYFVTKRILFLMHFNDKKDTM